MAKLEAKEKRLLLSWKLKMGKIKRKGKNRFNKLEVTVSFLDQVEGGNPKTLAAKYNSPWAQSPHVALLQDVL